MTLGASAPAGPSTVTATLTGDGGATVSDTVWLDTVDGTTVASTVGTQDLALQVIDLREERGLVTGAEAEAARSRALGGTDATVTATPRAGCTGVCLAGTVRWTDSAGGTHPVPRAPVQIWDEEPGADQLVATVQTDDAGAYTASIDNADGSGEGGRDVYVRVLAAGPGFTIVDKYIESATTADVATGTALTVGFVANTTADNNTAFSLQNAMVVTVDWVLEVRGAAFDDIDILFPSPGGGSFYDGTALHVDGGDRWDWDVMLHEYGHYVADQIDIEDNPGGHHSSEDNLSDSRGSKAIGIPLAWGEGWPTYFGVSLLREMGTASLGIPNIGDTAYQDTEDQVITQDLETGGTLGEDNEYSVMSVLWDLYDTPADGLDTVALGTGAVWDMLDAADPTSLSAAYTLFSPDESAASRAADCVFSQYNISPRLSGPATATIPSDGASPNLIWSRGNGGTHPNDRSQVEYRTAAGALLFASPPLTGTTYAAPPATWASIRAGSGGTVVASVVGTQTDAPVTGPYRSCARTFTVDPSSTATDRYIQAVYQALLGRAAEPSAVAHWRTQLDGGLSRGAFVKPVSATPEARRHLCGRVYVAILDREASDSDRTWCASILGSGGDLTDVAILIGGSPELLAQAGGTRDGFLGLLYQRALDRAIDPAALAHWRARLAAGATRGSVVKAVLESAEGQGELVDDAYEALLGRSPESSGRDYWVARQRSGLSDLALLVHIISSAEFRARAVA